VVRLDARRQKRSRPTGRNWRRPLISVVLVTAALLAGYGALEFIKRSEHNISVRAGNSSILTGSKVGQCHWWSRGTCVIDGDTIRFNGEKIRLADIDTPEIFSPKCSNELELGEKAKRRLLELINVGAIEVRSAGPRDSDQYGRKLRILAQNGRSIGDTLVAEGLARRWDGARRSWCS
jgi:micrococcal nuclease